MGTQGAALLARRVKGRAGRLLRAATGRLVRCNLCGWSGARFRPDNFHPGTVCPGCDAHLRHRLLAAAMTMLPEVHVDLLVDGRSVLHFAPEAAIVPLLRGGAGSYTSADLLVAGYADAYGDIDQRLDIADLASIGDGQVELVVACDVLEHVPDDRAALAEIRRVLAVGGWAVLTVPQGDDLATTFEDPNATTEEARQRLFGQRDHLRIYGLDFDRVLEAAGFRVVVVDHTAFAPRVVRRHVLHPPTRSTDPLATNHRRVFFGQRSPATGP